jgi:hypothetical protein
LQLALFNHQVLVVEVLDDVLMVDFVNLDDDSFDGGIALDQHACGRVRRNN